MPILSIIAVAYQILFSNFRAFLRLAWIPFCVCVIGEVIPIAFPENLDGGGRAIFSLLYYGITFITWLSTIPAITAWHRLVIFGVDDPNARVRYAIGSTERAYLWIAFVLYIAQTFAYVIAAMGIGMTSTAVIPNFHLGELGNQIIVVTAWLVGFFVTTGFLLALPSAAIGRKMNIQQSLAAVRGNIMRLFAAYLLAILPEYLLLQLLDLLFPEPAGSEVLPVGYSIGYIVLSNIVIFSIFTIAVSVLSIAYKLLVFSKPQPHEA